MNRGHLDPGWGWLILPVLVLAGCAAEHASIQPGKPKEGIQEFRQLIQTGDQAVGAALQALSRVEQQNSPCAGEVLTAFSEQVERLEVDSVQVRAHVQALLARGDSYFEQWQERMDELKDARLRALAQKHHQALLTGFEHIKRLCGETPKCFRPFLSGLRQIRVGLEAEPAGATRPAAKEQIQDTLGQGREVRRLFASIQQELDAMTGLLTPTQP